MSLWYFMLFGCCEISLWDFMPFGPCPEHVFFMAKEVMLGGGGGGLVRNIFRRSESSWLCMKFEFTFFAGHGILIKVLPSSCLALTVDELFPLFWPNSYATSCFVLQTFCVWDFLPGFSFFCEPLWDILMRFPYKSFCVHNSRMRFPYESSFFLLHNVHMRFHAFWASTRFACDISCVLVLVRFHEISVWLLMSFDFKEISLWDFMHFSHYKMHFLMGSHDFSLHTFMRFHAFGLLWDFYMMRFHVFAAQFSY